MKVNIKVTGIKDIDKALSKVEPKLAKKLLRQSMRKAAKLIQNEAKRNAPKDSGTLKKSIKVRSSKRSRSSIGIDIVTSANDNLYQGDTFYGAFHEFGTSKQAAQPFMRPAFDSKEKAARNLLEEELREGVKKLGGK